LPVAVGNDIGDGAISPFVEAMKIPVPRPSAEL